MKKLLILLLVSMLLISCESNQLPKPYNQFYVNDYADVLMTYTEREIVAYNRYLYEVYGEVQIVYATFLIKDNIDTEKYDRTELYRSWGIGKNDKGILVILYFQTNELEELKTKDLIAYDVEIGYNLEPYIPLSSIRTLVESSLYHEENYEIADLMVTRLNFELLNKVYVDLYDETPISYDMEVFYDDLISSPYIPPDDVATSNNLIQLVLILLTGNRNLYLIIPLILFGGLSTFGVFRLRGGGGSSGGIGIFRKRR